MHIEILEKQEGQETLSHPMQLVKACLFYMGRMDAEGQGTSCYCLVVYVLNVNWVNHVGVEPVYVAVYVVSKRPGSEAC